MKKLLTLLLILSLSFTFVACSKDDDIKIATYELKYPNYEKDDDEVDKFYVIEPDYVGGLYNYMMENYYSNSVNMNFKVAYAIRQNCQNFFDRSREFMIDLEIYNQISEKYVYYFAGLMYKRWLNSYDYLSDILKNELKDKDTEEIIDYLTNNYLAEDGPNGETVLKLKSYVPELNPLWESE